MFSTENGEMLRSLGAEAGQLVRCAERIANILRDTDVLEIARAAEWISSLAARGLLLLNPDRRTPDFGGVNLRFRQAKVLSP